MKNTKKSIALILCFTMMFLLCVPAYAADPVIDEKLLTYLESAGDDERVFLVIELDNADIWEKVDAAMKEQFPNGRDSEDVEEYEAYRMARRTMSEELHEELFSSFMEKYFNEKCELRLTSIYTGCIYAGVSKELVENIMTAENLERLALWEGHDQESIPHEDLQSFEFDADDVKEADWFFDAAKYVYAEGLMNGVGEHRFAPQDEVSRAMAITVLYRLAGSPPTNWDRPPEDPFDDLERGWYYNAVIWGVAYRIINGYGIQIIDGTVYDLFGPNDPVTREQLVAMLWRYQGNPAGEAAALEAFADAAEISDWAEDAFVWAVDAGVIQGKPGGILDPQGTITRAEVAQILMNYDNMK